MARRDDKLISLLLGLGGLGAIAFLLWPRRGSAQEQLQLQPAPLTAAQGPGPKPNALTQAATTATAALVTAGVGAGIKVGGSALTALLGGGSTAAGGAGATVVGTGTAATTTTGGGTAAAAGGTAATGASGAAMLTGLGIAAAMAAVIISMKVWESFSDRSTNARVLEDALEKILRALLAECKAMGMSDAEATAIAREWSCNVGQAFRDHGARTAAAWLTANCQMATAARAQVGKTDPKWIDMASGVITWRGKTIRLRTPTPIAVGSAYGLSFIFDFFQTFPSAPYYLDTEWTGRRDRTGAAMPPTSAANAAIDFAKAGIVPQGTSGMGLMEFLYNAFPDRYPNPNPNPPAIDWGSQGG